MSSISRICTVNPLRKSVVLIWIFIPEPGAVSCFHFRSMGQYGMVMRLIPSRILTFEDLGLPGSDSGSAHPSPWSGSGGGSYRVRKTTTLATMLDWINRNRDTHIVRLRPGEYYHPHRRSIVTHRNCMDVISFAKGCVPLRQDGCDLVGEMRDTETMQAAMQLPKPDTSCLPPCIRTVRRLRLTELWTLFLPTSRSRFACSFPLR